MHRSPSRHRPADYPPASSTRTGRQAPLLRFRLSVPSAFAGRAVPPGVTCSGPSRCGVAPTSAPTPGSRLAHAVFSASRLRCFQLRALETPPARVIRGRFLSAHVPGPRRAVLATWPGPSKSRRRPWDSLMFPSQFYFRPRVTMPRRPSSHPPAVSPLAAASFIVAGSTR